MKKILKYKIYILLLIVAIAFIVIGIITGQHTDVMNKAIRICLECIGIG